MRMLHINLDQVVVIFQYDTGGTVTLSDGSYFQLKKSAFDRLMNAMESK